MHRSSFPLYGLLIIFSLRLYTSHPIDNGLTDTDMDIFRVLLQKLEDSVSVQADPAPSEIASSLDSEPPRNLPEEEEEIRALLSAKNLKSLRNIDASRRSSSCFGGRLDRIGSMTSLGCKTVGRYNPNRR